MGDRDGSDDLLISYLTLRWLVGLLAFVLPPLLVAGSVFLFDAEGIKNSISSYYDGGMRDTFVGVLFAIACFLLIYQGYESKDNIAGNLAAIFAVGVALFPATSTSTTTRSVHFISAAAMFVTLAYFALFLFTKTATVGEKSHEKLVRNRIYRTCGVVILACIALIGIYSWLLDRTSIASIKPVFWLEAAALWAFGISWFVKGETLWRDPKEPPVEQRIAK